MSEQELIQALQELIARHSRPVEPGKISSELASRARVRMGLLAGVTTVLWLGGIAGILYMIFWFNRFITLYAPAPVADPDPHQLWHVSEEFHTKMELHHSLEACMVAVPLLLLAALCTVWLVFSSRRATLSQINHSLAEVSRQLRELRPPAQARESG
jgi:hypothetical protein